MDVGETLVAGNEGVNRSGSDRNGRQDDLMTSTWKIELIPGCSETPLARIMSPRGPSIFTMSAP